VDQARKIQLRIDELVGRRTDFKPMADLLAWDSLDRDLRKMAAAVTQWEPDEDAVDEEDDVVDEDDADDAVTDSVDDDMDDEFDEVDA